MTDAPYALVKTNQRFEQGWNRLQTDIEILVALVVAGLSGVLGTGPLNSGRKTVAGQAITMTTIAPCAEPRRRNWRSI